METSTDPAARARELLSDTDVAVLNAARGILKRTANGYTDIGYDSDTDVRSYLTAIDCGRCTEAFEHAEQAIFDALNTGQAYGSLGLTGDQLHNRRAPVAEGSSS